MPRPSAPDEWTVLRMLEWATEYLEAKKVPSARLSIEWLLADLLGCKRLDLYLKFDRPLSPEELELLKPALLRRAAHEPLQYITGSTDFYGLELSTTPAALIPRPETEQLVELVLEKYPSGSQIKVLDIGTGSGCIPIALKHHRREWQLHACDISRDALELARKNAARHETDITFFEHDLFTPRIDETRYDLIVSNPPYIPESERNSIEPQVRDFEPGQALFHPDIGEVYRALLRLAENQLVKNGRLLLEIHEHKGEEIASIFKRETWHTEQLKDYSGKDRFVLASRTH